MSSLAQHSVLSGPAVLLLEATQGELTDITDTAAATVVIPHPYLTGIFSLQCGVLGMGKGMERVHVYVMMGRWAAATQGTEDTIIPFTRRPIVGMNEERPLVVVVFACGSHHR